jgi:hypothetical protein
LVLRHRDLPFSWAFHFHDGMRAMARQAGLTALPMSFEAKGRLVTPQRDLHPHDSVSDRALDIGNNRAGRNE